MESNDRFEEGLSNRSSIVWVAERYEVSVLGKTIDHHQNNTLAMDAPKTFDEIHVDVRPHLRRDFKRVQEAC